MAPFLRWCSSSTLCEPRSSAPCSSTSSDPNIVRKYAEVINHSDHRSIIVGCRDHLGRTGTTTGPLAAVVNSGANGLAAGLSRLRLGPLTVFGI